MSASISVNCWDCSQLQKMSGVARTERLMSTPFQPPSSSKQGGWILAACLEQPLFDQSQYRKDSKVVFFCWLGCDHARDYLALEQSLQLLDTLSFIIKESPVNPQLASQEKGGGGEACLENNFGSFSLIFVKFIKCFCISSAAPVIVCCTENRFQDEITVFHLFITSFIHQNIYLLLQMTMGLHHDKK